MAESREGTQRAVSSLVTKCIVDNLYKTNGVTKITLKPAGEAGLEGNWLEKPFTLVVREEAIGKFSSQGFGFEDKAAYELGISPPAEHPTRAGLWAKCIVEAMYKRPNAMTEATISGEAESWIAEPFTLVIRSPEHMGLFQQGAHIAFSLVPLKTADKIAS
jgi:hypothetical protein